MINHSNYIKPLVLILCLSSLLFSALSVTGHGYHPPDDANRHVAKVLSGKDWREILVVRDDFGVDSHPGWHWILTAFYRLTGTDSDGLMVFSIVFMFLLFTVAGLFVFRHQEAWLWALLIYAVFNFSLIWRLVIGRPYIFSMFVLLLFFYLYEVIRDKQRPIWELVALTVLIALTTWIHCAWHLWFMPLFAILVARDFRSFKLIAFSILLGILLGSILVGNPLHFFYQTTTHLYEATSSYEVKRQLVSEFQPFAGDSQGVLIVAFFLLLRKIRGRWDNKVVDNPIFITMILGWLGGFVAVRFWNDWGWVALMYWVAKELDQFLGDFSDYFLSLKRLVFVTTACLALFLCISNDRDSRWSLSATATKDVPSVDIPEHKEALPQKGGILYSNNMGVFYRIFYQNPHAEFRYILGFEPVWMPKEDLKIYRKIQLDSSNKNYQPWVKKMRPEDRLIIISNNKPEIEGLEWTKIVGQYWSGRVKDATR
jgi:hypothetical protein